MAANFHKGTLGAFVKKVKRGEIAKGSVLILERLDRFSRNYFDIVFPVWLELLQSGLEIFSCVTRTHYTLQTIRDNPMLAGMALMELANANEYSRGMGKRIANAFDIRISLCKQGQKMNLGGWVPKWFDFIGEAKKAGEYRSNKHFRTIQRICNEYIAGRSMYQIARGLIADNTPTVMGGKWAQGTIANLLRHRTLLGTLEHKGLTIRNFFPPVLSKPEWDKLQAKLNENKARKGGGAGSDIVANLFRNRCKCATCGATITTARSSSDRIYTCKGKRVEKCPSKYSIRVSRLETNFFQYFLQQSPDDVLRAENPEHQDKVTAIQSRIAKLDMAIKDTTDLIGSVPVEELKTKLLRLNNERQNAKTELDKLNISAIGSTNAPKALEDIKTIFLKKYAPRTLMYPEVNKELRQRLGDAVVFNAISKALKDNATRQRLLTLLPSIVKGLLIDTTKKRYAVMLHSGKQSDWHYVAA